MSFKACRWHSTKSNDDAMRSLVREHGQRMNAHPHEIWDRMASQQSVSTPQLKGTPTMRIVRVFVIDNTESLNLEDRILYSGEEKITDLTDQELYYGIPMKELLDKHNAKRAATIDKKASERSGKDVMLEPIRIRDLSMRIVTIASF